MTNKSLFAVPLSAKHTNWPWGTLSFKGLVEDIYRDLRMVGVFRGICTVVRRVLLYSRTRINKPPATYLADRKWDVLIVLDACRWDDFCEMYGKQVPYIYSPGTWTGEWVLANFVLRNDCWRDVTVVTASAFTTPQVFEMNKLKWPFGECVNRYMDGWDDELDTVLPEDIAENAIKAWKKHGGRMLVHFLQPHIPWIPFVKENLSIFEEYRNSKTQTWAMLWAKAATDELSYDVCRKAYRESIATVIKAVEKIVEQVEGKVVITSDHGNLFGEYGLWGHPSGAYVPELLKVPWLEVEGKG